MFLRNAEYNGVKFAIMSRAGQGGGCVAKTKSALIIGVFQKEAVNSLGLNQNIGDVEKNVTNVGKILMESGL